MCCSKVVQVLRDSPLPSKWSHSACRKIIPFLAIPLSQPTFQQVKRVLFTCVHRCTASHALTFPQTISFSDQVRQEFCHEPRASLETMPGYAKCKSSANRIQIKCTLNWFMLGKKNTAEPHQLQDSLHYGYWVSGESLRTRLASSTPQTQHSTASTLNIVIETVHSNLAVSFVQKDGLQLCFVILHPPALIFSHFHGNRIFPCYGLTKCSCSLGTQLNVEEVVDFLKCFM